MKDTEAHYKWQKLGYVYINKAVKDALLKHYSEEIAICTVPSDGEKEDSITFFKGPENQK